MKTPGVDEKTGVYGFINVLHFLTHLGKLFSVSGIFIDIADNGTRDILIKTGANEAHLEYEFTAAGDGLFFGLEGALAQTSGGAILGTALLAYNKYREKGDTTNVLFWVVPTLISTGTTLLSKLVPGGSKAFAGGGSITARKEWILNPNTEYALRIQNIAGAAKTFSAELEYYEVEED